MIGDQSLLDTGKDTPWTRGQPKIIRRIGALDLQEKVTVSK
jgi:hypothetical protein